MRTVKRSAPPVFARFGAGQVHTQKDSLGARLSSKLIKTSPLLYGREEVQVDRNAHG